MPLFIPEYPLQTLNTLAVPAVAAWYVSVTDEQSLREALLFAREKSLPVMILGGGSNIVLRARFEGLVIHVKTMGITLVRTEGEHVYVRVAAGENWHSFVMQMLGEGYFGLENLALIPGTVGASPIQNIGAYGVEVKALIHEVETIERKSLLPVIFDKDACQFAYRDSFFKQAGIDQYVITHVTFKLATTESANLTYPGLQEALDSSAPSPQEVADAVIRVRSSKLPDPSCIPNVGSFFKNPVVSGDNFAELAAKYPNIPHYPQVSGLVKLAAGWLIDQAGWKGRELAGAKVHDMQALVLTNPARRDSTKVLALALAIVEDVEKTFGIRLEMEPRVY